jgi:rubredoxin
MAIYKCQVCGFEYEEEKGYPDKKIKPGTKFEELPEKWKCVCGAPKKKFKKTKDSLEQVIEILKKYKEGTPPGEVEME